MLVKLTGHPEPDKRRDVPPAHSLRAGKLVSPLKAKTTGAHRDRP